MLSAATSFAFSCIMEKDRHLMNKNQTYRFPSGFLATLTCSIILLSLSTPPVSAEDGAELLKLSGIDGGLIVHLGCSDGTLTAALRAGDQYFVHGLDTDEKNVAAARANIIKQGIYGPVSIDKWDGKNLPYADNLVNLIIAEDEKKPFQDEILRVLAPNGVALIRNKGKWQRIVKPRPREIDEWTHYLHDADGNPVADDTIVGPPQRLQWIGSPRWSRHHDHMASLTSLVSASCRLFYI